MANTIESRLLELCLSESANKSSQFKNKASILGFSASFFADKCPMSFPEDLELLDDASRNAIKWDLLFDDEAMCRAIRLAYFKNIEDSWTVTTEPLADSNPLLRCIATSNPFMILANITIKGAHSTIHISPTMFSIRIDETVDIDLFSPNAVSQIMTANSGFKLASFVLRLKERGEAFMMKRRPQELAAFYTDSMQFVCDLVRADGAVRELTKILPLVHMVMMPVRTTEEMLYSKL